jgi:hypothetical protein
MKKIIIITSAVLLLVSACAPKKTTTIPRDRIDDDKSRFEGTLEEQTGD